MIQQNHKHWSLKETQIITHDDTVNVVQKKNLKKNEKRNINNESHSDRNCYKCGMKYPHDGSSPAIGQRFRKCRGLNHFQEVYKHDKINTLETLDATKTIDQYYIFSMQVYDSKCRPQI